ncbi:hypothetical protein ACPV51_06895 [Vibrio astriarenae]
MEKDNVKIGLLFVLMSLVFWAGAQTNDPTLIYWDYIRDIAALIITAMTLLVAYHALSTWKVQHQQVERYKAIIALYHSAHDCREAFNRLRHRTTATYMAQATECREWQERADDYQASIKAMRTSLYENQQSINRYGSFLSLSEIQHVQQYDLQIQINADTYIELSKQVAQQPASRNEINKIESRYKISIKEYIEYLEILKGTISN